VSEIVRIVIHNYKKYQRETRQERSWVALSMSFFDDDAVKIARRKFNDAGYVFQQLWGLADQETGVVEISLDALTTILKKVCLADSNRFRPLERLDALAEKHFANKPPLISYEVLKLPKTNPKPVQNLFKTTLEKAETQQPQAATKVHITGDREHEQNTPPTPLAGGEGESSKKPDSELCPVDLSKKPELRIVPEPEALVDEFEGMLHHANRNAFLSAKNRRRSVAAARELLAAGKTPDEIRMCAKWCLSDACKSNAGVTHLGKVADLWGLWAKITAGAAATATAGKTSSESVNAVYNRVIKAINDKIPLRHNGTGRLIQPGEAQLVKNNGVSMLEIAGECFTLGLFEPVREALAG